MSFKSIVNGRRTDHKSSPCHYVIGELKRRRNGGNTKSLPTVIGRLNYFKFLDQWFGMRCCLKKKLRTTEVLNLFYRSPMVYFKENYILTRFQRFNRNPYTSWLSRRGLDPCPSSGSTHEVWMIYVGVWMTFFCFLLLNDALAENNLFIPNMDYKDNRSLSHIMYIFFFQFFYKFTDKVSISHSCEVTKHLSAYNAL